MARNTDKFEPNVTLGELLLLSRMAELFYDKHVSNPGLAVQSELNISPTRVRNAMIAIAAAVGPVELEGASRRTQQPSPRGLSVGKTGQLAALLIDMSADPLVDQSKLRLEIENVLLTLQKRHGEGKYYKSR